MYRLIHWTAEGDKDILTPNRSPIQPAKDGLCCVLQAVTASSGCSGGDWILSVLLSSYC